MSSIFHNTLLNAEPARYTVIAEAVLPGLLLLIFGSMYHKVGDEASALKNSPTPEVFAMVWFLLIAAWTIALVVAAMNFGTTGLVLVASFSFVALFVCVYWSYLYSSKDSSGRHHRRPEAARILILGDFVMWGAVVAAAACTASEDSKLTTAVLLSPVAVWLTISTLLGFSELKEIDFS